MEEQNNSKVESKKSNKKGKFNLKYVIIGVPIFIVQLVAVYFIMAYILIPKVNTNEPHQPKTEQKTEEGHSNQIDTGKEVGKFIHSFDDVIVNPAGTNGQKLLLTSLTFDVENEPSQKTIKEKEMIVKDIIISTLSSKSLIELSQVGYKDSLKIELANNLMASLKNVKVQSVYFTKYIIQ
jgi:flagellar FliL protein